MGNYGGLCQDNSSYWWLLPGTFIQHHTKDGSKAWYQSERSPVSNILKMVPLRSLSGTAQLPSKFRILSVCAITIKARIYKVASDNEAEPAANNPGYLLISREQSSSPTLANTLSRGLVSSAGRQAAIAGFHERLATDLWRRAVNINTAASSSRRLIRPKAALPSACQKLVEDLKVININSVYQYSHVISRLTTR